MKLKGRTLTPTRPVLRCAFEQCLLSPDGGALRGYDRPLRLGRQFVSRDAPSNRSQPQGAHAYLPPPTLTSINDQKAEILAALDGVLHCQDLLGSGIALVVACVSGVLLQVSPPHLPKAG